LIEGPCFKQLSLRRVFQCLLSASDSRNKSYQSHDCTAFLRGFFTESA
jgi:hypothetical protein